MPSGMQYATLGSVLFAQPWRSAGPDGPAGAGPGQARAEPQVSARAQALAPQPQLAAAAQAELRDAAIEFQFQEQDRHIALIDPRYCPYADWHRAHRLLREMETERPSDGRDEVSEPSPR